MSRIPNTLINTVLYIYPTIDDAERGSELGGTGFFFQEPSLITPKKGYTYAVTNAHVIFNNEIDNPILRINNIEGKFDLLKTSKDEWIRHPNGDDLAICPIQQSVKNNNFIAIKRGDIIKNDFIEKFNIGPGDDVVMVGRFRIRAGKEKNLPTHSFGNIAAMNEEPLYNPFTKLEQESFIVEMRSISGFSGSPVFIYMSPMSFRFNTAFGKTEALKMEYHQKLLGILWGHISYQTDGTNQFGEKIKIKLDSAMAGIIPGWKILELIDSEEILKHRLENDQRILKKLEAISKEDLEKR